MMQITFKQSLACSIAFCNGTCCEIKLIIIIMKTHTHTVPYRKDQYSPFAIKGVWYLKVVTVFLIKV
jgi:hypothetical protein